MNRRAFLGSLGLIGAAVLPRPAQAAPAAPIHHMVPGRAYCHRCDALLLPAGERVRPEHKAVRFGDNGFRVHVDGAYVPYVAEIMEGPEGWAVVDIMPPKGEQWFDWGCSTCHDTLCELVIGHVTTERIASVDERAERLMRQTGMFRKDAVRIVTAIGAATDSEAMRDRLCDSAAKWWLSGLSPDYVLVRMNLVDGGKA